MTIERLLCMCKNY